jgi:hypothetical protein
MAATMEVAMSEATIPLHHPAPAPEGPIVCTLSPDDHAGRLADFRRSLFSRLVGMERPEPTRLRLLLAADADPATVRELLVREQGCCAFLGFTITGGDDRLVADLEVPDGAAPALDAIAGLAELAAPWVAR